MSDDYPFHTEEIDGEPHVGLLAHGGRERIYEFVDPAGHGDYVRGRDPRDGSVLRCDSILNYAIAQVRGPMLPVTPVPAEEWLEVREEYTGGDWSDVLEFIHGALEDADADGAEVEP